LLLSFFVVHLQKNKKKIRGQLKKGRQRGIGSLKKS